MPNKNISAADTGGVAANLGLIFIITCLVVYLLHVGSAIMIPFFMAVFVWYLINAMARSFETKRVAGFGLNRFCSRLLAIMILLTGVWFVTHVISADAAEVFRSAGAYQKKLSALLPSLLEHLPPDYRPAPQDVASVFNLGPMLKALVQSFTGFAGKALVVLFYTGFFLYEQQFFGRKLKEMAKSRIAEGHVQEILKNIDTQMQHYISVKTFVSVMAGLFTWGLFYAYGLAFGGFWAVMVFFMTFIPYFGPMAAVVLPGVVGAVQLGAAAAFVPFVAGIALTQILWGGLVDRRLMGDTLNLSPIFVLLFLAAWLMIWGMPGMFLAVPIMSTLVIIFAQFSRTRGVAVLMSRTGEVAA